MRAEVAADSDARRITGIAVRYGEIAEIVPGVEEVFERGAFRSISDRMNLTLQHRRELPLGIPEWDDGEEALRVSCLLPAGGRQDQALSDAAAGLLRGLSTEFYPLTEEAEVISTDPHVVRYHVTTAALDGISIVDRPAYEGSQYVVERTALAERRAAAQGDVRRRRRRRAAEWACLA